MMMYKVDGMYGKATPVKGMVVSEVALASMLEDRLYTIKRVAPHTPVIRYTTCAGCERCTYDEYVPHYNCIYQGKAVGHSEAHCTAHACY